MKKTHYLIYEIKNIVNGKIYIGQHTTDNINDGYKGSGFALWEAYKKYGFDKFKKKILYDFDTFEEMDRKERELVNEEFILREDTYNIVMGGCRGLPETWLGKHHSDEAKSIMSLQKVGDKNNMFGKCWIVNYDKQINMVIGKNDSIPDGFVKGRCTDFKKWFDSLNKSRLTSDRVVIDSVKQKILEKRNVEREIKRSVAEAIQKELRKIRREERREQKVEKYKSYYAKAASIYNEFGFEKMCEILGYNKTRTNFFDMVKKYAGIELEKVNKAEYIKGKNLSPYAKKLRHMSKDERIRFYEEVYEVYKDGGFDAVVEKYDYPNTRNALLGSFKMYVSSYVPTKCNRWG